MAAEAKLKVTADTSQATRAISSLESGLGAMKAVAGVAIAALAGRATINALSSFIDEAREGEQALQGVASALARTGQLSKASLGDIKDFADQMSELTGIQDDAALKAFSLASAFGVSKDQAKEMVKAAAELSAATGVDLEAAVTQLGNSLDGSAGKLAQLSPAIRNLTKEQLEAGGAARVLLEQFGGTAQAQLQTFGGSVTQAGNAFANLQEALGQVITENPVVIAVIQQVSSVFKSLAKVVEDNKEGISNLLSKGIVLTVKGFSALIKPVKFVVGLFEAMFKVSTFAQGGIIQLLGAFAKFEIVQDIVKVVVIGLAEALKLIIDMAKVLLKFPTTVLEKMGVDISGITEVLDGVQITLDEIEETVATTDLAEAIQDGADSFASFRDAGIKAFDAVQIGIDNAGIAADKFAEKLEDVAKAGAKTNLPKNIPGGAFKAQAAPTDFKGIGDAKKANEEAEKNATIQVQQLLIPSTEAAVQEYSRRFAEAGGDVAAAFGKGLTQGGKEGARAFVAGAGGALVDILAPGFGAAATQALSFLGQDPEAFRAAVDGFIQGIPEIIDNIILNIPYLVQALADNSGEIITALVIATPQIATALANAMPAVAESLLNQLGLGIDYQIGKFNQAGTKFQEDAHNAGTAFSDSLKGAQERLAAFFDTKIPEIFGAAGKAITDAGKDFVAGITAVGKDIAEKLSPGSIGGSEGVIPNSVPILGRFASGGTVPSGFPNDSFTAGLTSGETVVPKDDVATLREFMATQGEQNGVVSALLMQVVQALQSPQQVSTSVQVDGQKLADVILNLNRRNSRLSA